MTVRRPVFTCDDTGNAERIATYHASDFRFVPAWNLYIVWQNTHWQIDEGGVGMLRLAKSAIQRIKKDEAPAAEGEKLQKALLGWYRRSRDRSRVEAAIKMARAEDVCVDHELLDRKPMLLNCKNGTLNLKDGSLRRHSSIDLITKVLPIKYSPDAKAPRWEKFLNQVIPAPEVQNFLQRYVGYCLTGDVGERKVVILHGEGRNGKSVFGRVLQDVLGPYARTAPPGLLMDRKKEAHPEEVATLFGARLAVLSEVKKGRALDEEQFKRLSGGGDKLAARRMRENTWEFYQTHKLLMIVNSPPKVRDTTKSIWDRILLVPFNTRIADHEEDTHLLDKLRLELPGILAWAVRGCLAWQKDGLQVPETVKLATRKYHDAEDRVGQWFSEKCVVHPGLDDPTPTEMFVWSAAEWCKDKGYRTPITEKEIISALDERGFKRGRKGYGGRRGWLGVALDGDRRVRSLPKTAANLRLVTDT